VKRMTFLGHLTIVTMCRYARWFSVSKQTVMDIGRF
jgi:hypothetical protein